MSCGAFDLEGMKNPIRQSFTLTEILAATAILMILFTIMFGILQQTSIGWQAANRRVEASQVARLAMDQIASDLENCIAVAQANVSVPGRSTPTNYAYGFFHSNQPSTSQSWLPSSINISRPNDFIFVVTPYAPSLNTASGDLCEVGYIPIFVANQAGYSTMRGGRYILVRHLPLTNAGTTVANARPVNDFLANSAGWETTPTGVDTVNRLPFVDNCLKFNITFLYTNAGGQLLSSETWGRPTINGNVVSWQGNPAGVSGLPMAADIQMCTVDERTAERIWRIRGMTGLNPQEIGGLPTNFAAVSPDLRTSLQESVLTLERRIYFKNR
jgi:type II secretory pathway pseudopilin PulG